MTELMKRKPRLLVVSHSPGLSGAERSLLETLRLLAPFYELHVVIPGEGKLLTEARRVLAPSVASLNVVKFYFDYAHENTQLWRQAYWRAANRRAHHRIVAIARSIGAEAVYSNAIASWQGADCARVLGLPHIWHLRELILGSSIGFPLRGQEEQIRRLADPKTVFLSNSRYVAEWYRSKFAISPNVAYQPVRVNLSRAARQDSELRMLSVGRLQFEKRHHVAIEAIAKLPQGLKSRVRLEIFGEGPERAALQAMIEQSNLSTNVALRGFSEKLQKEISRADVVLTTSVGEPFGRVTAEALLIGCPVIGVNSGGTAELLGNRNQRGLLRPADDPDALAEAIISFSNDPGAATARARAGCEWARRTLSPEHYLDTLRAAISEAVSKEARTS